MSPRVQNMLSCKVMLIKLNCSDYSICVLPYKIYASCVDYIVKQTLCFVKSFIRIKYSRIIRIERWKLWQESEFKISLEWGSFDSILLLKQTELKLISCKKKKKIIRKGKKYNQTEILSILILIEWLEIENVFSHYP